MSLFSDFAKTVGGELLDMTLREKLQPIFDQLTRNFAALRNGLTSLNFTDNFECDVVSLTFSHGVAQNVRLSKLRQARCAVVLSSYGAIPFGTPDVAMVGDRQAAVTLWFTDVSKTSVPVALLLFNLGGRSSQS